MTQEHDFKNFPELTNSQMALFYFSSPHKQITEDFFCKVIRVTDGDTIQVMWEERDFDFPIRFLDINAPEMNEERGAQVKDWLRLRIENQEVEIRIDKTNRVDKWGRLLGRIFHRGMDTGNEMRDLGLVTSFEARNEGKIPNINKTVRFKWD